MTIPNFITIGRLFLVPLIMWLIIAQKPMSAFWCFVIAGVSDAVDGFLARQFDMRSDLGTYLDPLADKVLLVSIYVVFAVLVEIPIWLAMVVVSRDLLIIGGVLLAWMLGRPVAMRPRAISKVNTVAQIVLAAVVLADLAFALDVGELRKVLVDLVAGLTVASMAVYMVDWVQHMSASQTDGGVAPGRSAGKGQST